MYIRIYYLFIDSKVKFSSTKNKILRFDLTIMLPYSLRCKFMYKHNTDRYVIFLCRYMGRHVFRYENMLQNNIFIPPSLVGIYKKSSEFMKNEKCVEKIKKFLETYIRS